MVAFYLTYRSNMSYKTYNCGKIRNMNEAEQERPAQSAAVIKPQLGKYFFFLLLVVAFVAAFWIGWRKFTKKQPSTYGNLLATMPTPSYTATPSAKLQVATEFPQTGVLGVNTTKGGLAIVEETPYPTLTPKPTTTPTPAPSINLNRIYLDAQFSYKISFSDGWTFRRTHGTDAKGSEEGILSQVDLSKPNPDSPQAYIAASVFAGKGATDINRWVFDNDRNTPDTSMAHKLTFAGVPAVKFILGNNFQKLYFIKGAYVYRLDAWQNGPLSTETLAIRDSFQP